MHRIIKYAVITFLGLLIIYFVVYTYKPKTITKNNTTRITGIYKTLESVVAEDYRTHRPSADTSYNLYLEQSNLPYRIDESCFMKGLFKNDVRDRQPITIYVGEDRHVFCIICGGKEYLSFDCINRVNDEQIRYLPFLLAVVLAYMVGNACLKKHVKI